MMNNNKIALWALVCICIIIAYLITILYTVGLDHDPMLITVYNTEINGWLISHFIVFCLAGYFYPDTFKLAMVIGIVWECFEFALGYFLKNSVLAKPFIYNWWYGQYRDIIANALGFLFGKYISTII